MALWAFTSHASTIVDNIEALRQAHIGWLHIALSGRPDDPRLAHLLERLLRIPTAKTMWDAQQITGFANGTTQLGVYSAGRLTGADLFSTEQVGGYRLLIILLGGKRPDQPPPQPALSSAAHPRSDPAGPEI
jgi:MmyB-like transcription regulator ligand binding domain